MGFLSRGRQCKLGLKAPMALPANSIKAYSSAGDSYETDFAYFSAFARGVANASTKAGVGAWGYKRMWTPSADYVLPDPWKTRFFQDVVQNDVPIKAATFHWDCPSYCLI